MNGISFLIIAAIVLAAYAVYDKFVVFSHIQDEQYLAFTSRLMVCLFVAPFLLLPSISVPAFDFAVISFLTGFIFLLAAFIYFTGVKHGDPSTMIVFLNTKPALVVIAAGILLGEVLTTIQYAGIVVIIGATLLLTFARIDGELKLRETAKYGAVFAVTVASIDLISKYVVTNVSPLSFFALAGLGQGVGGLAGIGWLWYNKPSTLRENTHRAGVASIITRTLFYVVGLTLFFTALKTVTISVATSIVATQTALTVFFAWIIVRLGTISDHDLGDIPFSVKMLAALGIIAGVILLSQPAALA
jgi:drug/metabolite transporter (DMT)-like permease